MARHASERAKSEQDEVALTGRALEYATRAANMVALPEFNVSGSFKGPCGNTIQLWLLVEQGRVVRAYVGTNGCRPAIACGYATTELVTGKSLEEASGSGPRTS